MIPVADPASDATSGVASVRLSDDGVTWETFPYAPSIDWDLLDAAAGGSGGIGAKTVHAQWVDGAGNVSAEVTASIPYGPSTTVSRLAGADRFATAAAISAAAFPTPGVPVAYIAYAYGFPDALAGSVAAARAGGPILLADSVGTINAATARELTRLGPQRIVLLGGTGVLSDLVARQGEAFVARSPFEQDPLAPYFMPSNPYGSFPHDENGIVLVPYGSSLEYNPVTISQVAIGFYTQILATGSPTARDMFFRHVDWLVDHQLPDGRWLFTFPFGPQPVPWWSAMAEGMAISALVRAYGLTGSSVYATAASRALSTFTRLQSDAGVAQIDGGYTWYEEYMPPYARHTLNGLMFSMIGLWDYHMVFGDALSASLFDKGIATLVHDLPRFDTGRWSCYSLTATGGCNMAYTGYHKLHIAELRYFYGLTRIALLDEYADRWEAYLADPPPGV